MPERHELDSELRYAWDWFAYHAAQRFTAFNFFLIVFGAEIVGYTQAAAKHLTILGVVLGFVGTVVAVAFWAMEVRNAELVTCGREALNAIEKSLLCNIRADDQARKWLRDALPGRIERTIYDWLIRDQGRRDRRLRIYTHACWLRAVLVMVAVLSLLGSVWAAFGFPGNA